jgi:DNA polymerase-3 subunit gamma/tau
VTSAARGESVPPPDEPPDDEIPDDYGEPPAAPTTVRDPEEAAIELITAQLGGRRLEDDPATT